MSNASPKKKVLITGAMGFTGRHLASLLSRDQTLVLTLSGLSPEANLLNFSECDFLNPSSVKGLITESQPDQIYHLIGSYTNEYERDYASNVLSTKHLLDAVREAGTNSRVLLVGSSAEYGFPDDPTLPVREIHPLRPVSVYGLVKVYQHTLAGTYSRLYNMDIVEVRPFNLKGKGISSLLFVGKMEEEIRRYKNGEIQSIVTGDLSVERDYIDIDEAIKYYRRVQEAGKTGEVYNVGSGKASSLRDVLSEMLKVEGLTMDIVKEGKHAVPGKMVVPKLFADITSLKKL
ncbi:MAG: NAD-dependent epimerase/dehydratase family protein [bacterium]|nr:NAD-dependent epimerase/dehydratase family protein [bacterium]